MAGLGLGGAGDKNSEDDGRDGPDHVASTFFAFSASHHQMVGKPVE